MKTAIVTAVVSLALVAQPAFADKVTDAIEKADKKLAEGKSDDAIKTIDKLRKDFGADPRVYAALARMHVLAGIDASKFDQARAALEAGVTATRGAGKAHADALANLAAFELHAGTGAAALEQAGKAVQAQETPLALAVYALTLTRGGELPQAKEAVEKAVAMAPGHSEVQRALGEVLLATGSPKEAEAAFRKAVQADAKAALAQEGLARALLVQERGSEAVAAARQATTMDESSARAFATLGITLLEGEKNWNEAIAQAQQGAFLNPRDPVVLVAVAKIFEAAQNHQQALMKYQEALRIDPDFAPAKLSQIPVKVARGDLEGAEEDVATVVKAEPNNAEANLLLCQIRVRQNKHAQAIESCRKAAAAKANDHQVQALLAGTLYYAGQYSEAADAYARAADLAPENLEYRKNAGFILGLAGKVDEGLAQLEQVLASPGYDDPTGYLAAGDLYRETEPKRLDDAIKAYSSVLQLDPKNSHAAMGLGQAQYGKKDFDGAIAAFQKAISIEPKTAGQASSHIGWCYLGKREAEQARAWAEKAQAAGASTTQLVASITEYEKRIKEHGEMTAAAQAEFEAAQERQRQEQKLLNDYESDDPSTRRRAVAQLARVLGTDAYDHLLHALSADKDPSVKGAACSGLARMGSTGKKATRHIMAFVELTPPVVIEDDKMEYWSLVFEAQSACRAALRRLQ